MYLLHFYVPLDHAEKVKDAVFAAGAGRIGTYDRCAWESRGQGQYRPLSGSRPFLGREGETETVEELKVEMVCDEAFIHKSIAALKAAHPYETPAYHVIKVENF